MLYGVAGLWFVALTVAIPWARRSVSGRAVMLGLLFFIVGMGPALTLPQHRYMYLIGVGAFGSSLALVAAARAAPRAGRLLATGVVAATLIVAAFPTAAAVRESEEFRFMQGLQVRAAGWLRTVDQQARLQGDAREVLVPRLGVTSLVFETADAHRLFYGATYEVRLVDANQHPTPSPTRIIVGWAPLWQPGTPLPGQRPQWDWLRWIARLCIRDAWAP